MKRRRLASPVVAVLVTLALMAIGTERADSTPMPFASGDNAANIPLDTSRKWVMQRWVARHTGVIERLYFYAKSEGSDDCPNKGRSGYADGTSGRLLATTHRVLPSGLPDMSVTLARSEFRPCGNDHEETVSIELGFPVTQGDELATIVRNVDPSPSSNWFSANFLYVSAGVAGANGRNERNAEATDAYYGLDPRELVGYSTDGGSSWRLPGGPYGGKGGAAFVPTYLQAYVGGPTLGQPYYWSSSSDSSVAMIYPNVRKAWTIRELGAYTDGSSSGTVALEVDGSRRAQVTLSGSGFLRAPITPIEVRPGQTVRVTTSGGLEMREMQVDRFWAEKVGLGTGNYFFLDGDEIKAATVFPLPAYWVTTGASTGPPPPPAAALPARKVRASATLSMKVGLKRTLVWLTSRRPGRAAIALTIAGRPIARCSGLRLRTGKRVGCHVNLGRSRLAGLLVATATVTQGGNRLRLKKRARIRPAGVRTAQSVGAASAGGAGAPSVAVSLTVRPRSALAVVHARRSGTAAVVVSVPGQTTARCREQVRRSRAGLECRAELARPAPGRSVVASVVMKSPRGAPTMLRVTGAQLP